MGDQHQFFFQHGAVLQHAAALFRPGQEREINPACDDFLFQKMAIARDHGQVEIRQLGADALQDLRQHPGEGRMHRADADIALQHLNA